MIARTQPTRRRWASRRSWMKSCARLSLNARTFRQRGAYSVKSFLSRRSVSRLGFVKLGKELLEAHIGGDLALDEHAQVLADLGQRAGLVVHPHLDAVLGGLHPGVERLGARAELAGVLEHR